MKKKKFKVIIIEPSYVLREGIKNLIEESPDFEIERSFSDMETCLPLLHSIHPDLILVDPYIFGMREKYKARTSCELPNGCKMIAIMSQQDDEEMLKQYDEIIGLFDNPKKILNKLRNTITNRDSSTPPESALSERELEILGSITKGMGNKEIAQLYNISINTVISHRKNITRKTGIKSIAGLTMYAILNNLIDADVLDYK